VALQVGRWRAAAALFGLAALAREDALVIPLAAAIYAWARRERRPRELVAFAALAVLPVALWWSYLASELPPSATSAASRLTFPLFGLIDESLGAFQVNETRTNLVRSLSVSAVALWLIFESFFGIRRAPTLLGALACGEAVLCSVLRGDVWSYYAGSVRILAPLSIFSMFWFFARARGAASPRQSSSPDPSPRARPARRVAVLSSAP
jgi:hypothetical protein